MKALFADTYFYLALLREDESGHARALTYAASNQVILTTEFILLELGNACARAEDHRDFLALVAGMRASPRGRIISLDSHLFNLGLQYMDSRPDKDWSLTDCISFVVMEAEGIRAALTADQHFEQAGFTALLKV